MKALSPDLQDHLSSGTTTLCWCWRLERRDGAVFGFTDHDRPLSFDGAGYEALAALSASEVRAAADLSVDGQDAQGALVSDAITETDIADGLWDNAAVEVYRVNWADPAQRVLMRRGNLGQITRGRVAFTAEVRSLAHVLNQPGGRTYQYYCDAMLGDARCGKDVSGATFTGTGAVTVVSGDRGFGASGLGAFADGWFSLGLVSWATGANAGRMAEVMVHDVAGSSVVLTLAEPPVRAIAVGDSFSVVAGCDKQASTCRAKFANLVNFRGFPTIPGDETMIRYPNSGDANAGAVLGNRS
jgi:uncharacterized phage protein (TIGR02218 family)